MSREISWWTQVSATSLSRGTSSGHRCCGVHGWVHPQRCSTTSALPFCCNALKPERALFHAQTPKKQPIQSSQLHCGQALACCCFAPSLRLQISRGPSSSLRRHLTTPTQEIPQSSTTPLPASTTALSQSLHSLQVCVDASG